MASGSPAVAGVLERCDRDPWQAEPGTVQTSREELAAATTSRAVTPVALTGQVAAELPALPLLRLRVLRRCGRSRRRASGLPLLRPWRLSRPRPRQSRSGLRQHLPRLPLRQQPHHHRRQHHHHRRQHHHRRLRHRLLHLLRLHLRYRRLQRHSSLRCRLLRSF